jgi:hypothetical protein
MVVITPRRTKTPTARTGGFHSKMSPYVIDKMRRNKDQHATPCKRIIGMVFRPKAASPERSLKSWACPWRLLVRERAEGIQITRTVRVNITPVESMATIDVLLMGW